MAKVFNSVPFEYHTQLELVIENITNLGLGIGRYNGWVIMVPNVAIGEHILCQIFRNHSNYSEADLVQILEASPNRIEPVCPLFGTCGGCQYQHLRYECQLRLKRQHVQEIFQKIAGIEIEVSPIKTTQQIDHYRSKLTPHFEKKLQNIGFLKNGSRFQLVDVEQCCIATRKINEKLKTLREETKKKKFKSGGTLLLRDTGQSVETDPKKIITQCIGPWKFLVRAGEFFQNNPYILPDFVDYIIREASDRESEFLIDTYCGVGVFGICGSAQFSQVTGIEINECAIDLARQNAEINNTKNVRFLTGSAENIFPENSIDPQRTSLIIDPPRKGCDFAFLQQLAKFSPRKVVYVSCSPDTQARDIKILLFEGYKIQNVQPFDLFPQTRHIENVVTLVKD